MSEQAKNPNGIENSTEAAGKKNKISKGGKLFLLSGVLLLQGFMAHAVVKSNYPELREMAVSFTTAGSGGVYYQFENIIISPAGSSGGRYILLSIAVELDNKKDQTYFESKNVEVLDRFNFILSSMSLPHFLDENRREQIKEELIAETNKLFGGKLVRNLYFTKYVIQ